MLFQHGAMTFDTDLMVAFSTSDPLLPTIYQSGRHVLLAEVDGKLRTQLRYASEPDVYFCARKYALAPLLQAYAEALRPT